MSKQKKSKLDPFAEQLEVWFKPVKDGGENLGLVPAAERLEKAGCKISPARLCGWWQSRQRELSRKEFLDGIYSGAKHIQEAEAAFAENPAPVLRLLIDT